MDDMILNCELVIKRENEVVNTFNYSNDEKGLILFTKALSYVVNRKNHENIVKTTIKSDSVKKVVKIYVYFNLNFYDGIVKMLYEYTFSGEKLDDIYIW